MVSCSCGSLLKGLKTAPESARRSKPELTPSRVRSWNSPSNKVIFYNILTISVITAESHSWLLSPVPPKVNQTQWRSCSPLVPTLRSCWLMTFFRSGTISWTGNKTQIKRGEKFFQASCRLRPLLLKANFAARRQRWVVLPVLKAISKFFRHISAFYIVWQILRKPWPSLL